VSRVFPWDGYVDGDLRDYVREMSEQMSAIAQLVHRQANEISSANQHDALAWSEALRSLRRAADGYKAVTKSKTTPRNRKEAIGYINRYRAAVGQPFLDEGLTTEELREIVKKIDQELE